MILARARKPSTKQIGAIIIAAMMTGDMAVPTHSSQDPLVLYQFSLQIWKG